MRPIIIAAAVVLTGLAVTNPGKEDYAGWAKNQMAKKGWLAGVIGSLMPSSVIESTTNRTNLLVFSIFDTRISDTSSIRTVGIATRFIPLQSQGVTPLATRTASTSPTTPSAPAVVKPPPLQTPVSPEESQEPKCTAALISKREGHYLPGSDALQVLAVQRNQQAGPRNDAYCQNHVVVAKFDPISKSYIPVWQTDLRGPGLVFTDGYWHRQGLRSTSTVTAVKVLPPPYDKLEQVLIYEHDVGGDAGNSFAKLVVFTSQFGNEQTLLNIAQHGAMDVHVEDGTIVVNGYFIPDGACLACGESRTLRLRFNREVKQLAIENPDRKAAEFFQYLRRHAS
jgi:hypothetical protein